MELLKRGEGRGIEQQQCLQQINSNTTITLRYVQRKAASTTGRTRKTTGHADVSIEYETTTTILFSVFVFVCFQQAFTCVSNNCPKHLYMHRSRLARSSTSYLCHLRHCYQQQSTYIILIITGVTMNVSPRFERQTANSPSSRAD